MNKEKIIILIALAILITGFYMMLQGYGALNEAYNLCLNRGGIFG